MASTALKTKFVLKALADLYSRGPMSMVHNMMLNYTDRFAAGVELVEIPSIGTLTTAAVHSSGDDVQSISAQQVAPSALGDLKCDQNRGVFILEEDQRKHEYLEGSFYDQTVQQAAQQLLNYMDENVVDYLTAEIAYDASATYHDNVAGDSLAVADMTAARAAIMANDGMKRPAYFFHPYGVSNLMSISGWQPNLNSEMGNLGIPMVGSVNGIPVFETNSINRQRTVAASASAISSNVITLTVAAGHGIVPGVKITTAGATTDIDTAAAVTSVTATTVVAPLTASNDAANGACTITIDSCENLLVDLNHCHFGARSVLPMFRSVPVSGSVSNQLQLWNRWGRIARAGRVRVIHSPVNG